MRSRCVSDYIDLRITQQGIRTVDGSFDGWAGVQELAAHLQYGQRPALRKLIMLATPNHGSELADGVVNPRNAHWLSYRDYRCPGEWAEELTDMLLVPYVDVRPRSALLVMRLNYDGQSGLAWSNSCCDSCQHPNETTLRYETEYFTYTAEDYPSPVRAPWPMPEWGGERLYHLASGCPNDEVVPRASVPLAARHPQTNVHNVTDRQWGCVNWHAGNPWHVSPGPVTDDACAAGVVHLFLQGRLSVA